MVRVYTRLPRNFPTNRRNGMWALFGRAPICGIVSLQYYLVRATDSAMVLYHQLFCLELDQGRASTMLTDCSTMFAAGEVGGKKSNWVGTILNKTHSFALHIRY